jgi:hypothetical protein
MTPYGHGSNDSGERLEVRLLRRDERDPLEERDDRFDQSSTIPNDEHEGAIAFAVRFYVPTAQSLLHQLEHLSSVAVLTDVELRQELQPDAARWIALHRDGERALAVDVACDVAVEYPPHACCHDGKRRTGREKKGPPYGGPQKKSAATYSPGRSPSEYHRRKRA